VTVESRAADAQSLAGIIDADAWVVAQSLGKEGCLVPQHGFPSSLSASRPGGGEAGEGSLPDQLSFELGQGAEDVEHQATPARGGVDAFLERPKPYSSGLELGNHLDEVGERSAEAIQTPDDNNISRSSKLEKIGQAGPVGFGSACFILKDPF
jgi:hypothetical protein